MHTGAIKGKGEKIFLHVKCNNSYLFHSADFVTFEFSCSVKMNNTSANQDLSLLFLSPHSQCLMKDGQILAGGTHPLP